MKLSIIASITALSLLIYGFSSSTAKNQWEQSNNGSIGDVKYSILAPEQFKIVNGAGWLLLDGSVLDESSDLSKLLNSTGQGIILKDGKLPNADGVFIRSVDSNESDSYGDVDKGRTVGSFQSDAFQGHSHFATDQKMAVYKGRETNNTPHQRHTVTGSPLKSTAGTHKAGHGAPRISKETRPKNICLYTYIKVNN